MPRAPLARSRAGNEIPRVPRSRPVNVGEAGSAKPDRKSLPRPNRWQSIKRAAHVYVPPCLPHLRVPKHYTLAREEELERGQGVAAAGDGRTLFCFNGITTNCADISWLCYCGGAILRERVKRRGGAKRANQAYTRLPRTERTHAFLAREREWLPYFRRYESFTRALVGRSFFARGWLRERYAEREACHFSEHFNDDYYKGTRQMGWLDNGPAVAFTIFKHMWYFFINFEFVFITWLDIKGLQKLIMFI